MRGNDLIESLYAENFPVPFMSLWIDDCVERATDYNAGGARYNNQYLQVVGLGTFYLLSFSHKISCFPGKEFNNVRFAESPSDRF